MAWRDIKFLAHTQHPFFQTGCQPRSWSLHLVSSSCPSQVSCTVHHAIFQDSSQKTVAWLSHLPSQFPMRTLTSGSPFPEQQPHDLAVTRKDSPVPHTEALSSHSYILSLLERHHSRCLALAPVLMLHRTSLPHPTSCFTSYPPPRIWLSGLLQLRWPFSVVKFYSAWPWCTTYWFSLYLLCF